MENKRKYTMKYGNTLFLTILSAFFFSGCATSYTPVPTTDYETIQSAPQQKSKKNKRVSAKSKIGFKQIGIASYYGYKWNGRTTANGERLNLSKFTAAHKSLPFNSLVKVTDLDTGKSVVVRINDRGPYINGRIIDLTDSAARKLGITHKGIARVKIEVIG
jgi:rare lipoprotein A